MRRVHALVERLDDEVIAVAVHHQCGQQIGFAVHHPVGIGVADHAAAVFRGGAQAAAEKTSRSIASTRRESMRRAIWDVEL